MSKSTPAIGRRPPRSSDKRRLVTALFPLVFEAASDPRAALIRRQGIPARLARAGMSFPLLRYGSTLSCGVNSRLASREVVYNFLGTSPAGLTSARPSGGFDPARRLPTITPKKMRARTCWRSGVAC